MPKIYKYFGIIFYFYSKEHLPVHVHGRKAGRENKAEIIISEGVIISVKIKSVKGKLPLLQKDRKEFANFVEAKAEDIKNKWIDFFVENKKPDFEEITEL